MTKLEYIRKVEQDCYHHAIKCGEMGLDGISEALRDVYTRISDIRHFEWHNEELQDES